MDTAKPPKPNFLRNLIAQNFIDLRDLPDTLKLLTVVGYLVVLGQLVFTLLVDLAGERLPKVVYSLPGSTTNQVPLFVMAIAGLSFILGWAYLLAGAAAAKARVFLPVLVLFAVQLFLVASLLGFVLELVFFVVVLIIYGLTFRTPFWRDLPGLHFFGWLAAVSVIVLLSVGTSATNAEVAIALSTNFGMVMLLTLLFWVVLSFSVFDLGIKIGRFFTRFARKYLPFPTLNALVIFLLLIHPVVAALIIWLGRDPFWSFDMPFSIVFPVAALIVWITRRWSPSVAAVFLALSLTTPVVMVGLSGAFAGKSSFAENLLKLTGIFTPTLMFVALTTYNLFGIGVTFTGVDGRILPKRARVLLYFGTLLLVVACMLFASNETLAGTNQLSTDFQEFINGVIAVSAFLVMIPYGIWMIWKRRELLIGPEKDLTGSPRWAWLESFPGPAWLALSLILASACACAGGVILISLVYK